MPSRSSQAPSRWIVIPVHNRLEITRSCLAHLAQLKVHSWAHVLVADDGSTDGTAAMIRAEFPWAEILTGPGDWWWAGAIRAGMQHAIQHGAETLAWLNDDTHPDAGSLERLFAEAETRAGICGGISQPDDASASLYSGGTMDKRWPKAYQSTDLTKDSPTLAQWLHGNMVVLHASVWQRLGLPDTRGTIHNYADIEYTYRAYLLGIPVLIVPQATAQAHANLSASYLSWRDSRVSLSTVWQGFVSPKVWWYLPGLLAFKVRQFGWLGLWDCGLVLSKFCLLPMHKAWTHFFASDAHKQR